MLEQTAYDNRYIDHEREEEGDYLRVYFSLSLNAIVIKSRVDGEDEEEEEVDRKRNLLEH